MKTRLLLSGAIAAGVVVLACSGALPTAPTAGGAGAGTLNDTAGIITTTGMTKETISGTIQRAGGAPPARSVVTPSRVCHSWDLAVFTQLTGDVTGPVTFHEQIHDPGCDRGHFVASGPFEGEVTWNGRSGIISGQFTTNCTADPSQPLGTSCGGTMNARGAGGLDGVQFHFKWGPGWYPFSYTGTAYSK